MVELLTPGVIIQEVEFGPQPIEGVSTSTAGFVGDTERGLSEGPPVFVTSFADFQRKFGGLVPGKDLPQAVRGFFDNGGRRAYISRVVHTGATAGSLAATRGYNVRLTSTPIVSGGTTTLTLSSVVGLDVVAGVGSITIFPVGATAGGATFAVSNVDGATGTVKVTTAVPADVGPNTHYVQISAPVAGTVLTVNARDKGVFSGRLGALVDAVYGDSTRIESAISTTEFIVSNISLFEVGSSVQFEAPFSSLTQDRDIGEVLSIDPVARKITLSAAVTGTYTGGKVLIVDWRTTVTFDGAVVETLTGLSAKSPAALATDVAAASQWIRIAGSSTVDPSAGIFPLFLDGAGHVLSAGLAGGAVDEDDVVGQEVPVRTGLKAIEAQTGISLIAAPGFTTPTVVGELIAQAERRQDRFAVFESNKPGATPPDVTTVLTQRGQYNSKYAAMYHPWLTVGDTNSSGDLIVPPSGHVIGAYARTDNDRGVFKAPANVVLRGITGFTQVIPDGEQDLFNPAGVNILRSFTGLGNVIWGARTISAESIWRYVPVRRLFIFIEQSLVQGTRFAVFEPNDTRLWARLRDGITNFLTSQWRAGALFGSKPQEAFFVKVDETTTTQDDRDNGRVNILIGLAPVKPAEFIVFQIGQAPQSVIIAEQG